MSLIFTNIAGDLRRRWKPLLLTSIVYKVIAFVLLTPLAAGLFRVLLAASGNSLLADTDLLFFVTGPSGWLCLVTVGAVWIGISAVEVAALMAILASADSQPAVINALRFASASAWQVVQVTARVVAISLLAAAPFLAIAAATYFTMLTRFDINYYLTEWPPEFILSLGIGAVVAAGLVALVIWLATSWFFALPIVLFDDIPPASVLRASRDRAAGHRRMLFVWITAWAVAPAVLSIIALTAIVGLGRFLIPFVGESFTLLVVALGASLLLSGAVSLAANLFSTTSLAAIMLNLYRHNSGERHLYSTKLYPATGTAGNMRWLLSPRPLIAAGALGTLAALAIGAVAVHSIHIKDDVKIIAHRGSSLGAPENTIAAVRLAIKEGADWVEIDVQESADGQVVVFHDSDFMKLAGEDLKIWDATAEDFSRIDIGSWFAADFHSERVPTLADVLDECRGNVGVLIELKYYGHDERLEERVSLIVAAHDMNADVLVMSLKADAVKKMKATCPDWQVGLLMSVAAGKIESTGADFLAVNAAFTDRGSIRAAHRRGQEIYAWTVNDAATMSTLISRGVDGLITDDPALARSVLQQRAVMSPPERLLLELAGIFGAAPELGEE
ncbi:MAG: glycerophosphodiester phosphodiesterase family protein [Aeoliella sp.]